MCCAVLCCAGDGSGLDAYDYRGLYGAGGEGDYADDDALHDDDDDDDEDGEDEDDVGVDVTGPGHGAGFSDDLPSAML